MKTPANSFTSADSFPVKLIRNVELIRYITANRLIPPFHAQVIPTNACNLACSFCSCIEEDRSMSMSPVDMVDLIFNLKQLGTQGITITGGGEPLLYPHLKTMLHLTNMFRIETGLVTNGILLTPDIAPMIEYLTWCRVSFGDEREPFSDEFKHNLTTTVLLTETVDWAFSYVVSEAPNIDRIMEIIKFADLMNFTHVRLVADLLDPDKVPMDRVRKELQPFVLAHTVPVIFQGRQHPERGADCYICYLKPVIAPDLRVYACCGVQYALATPSRKLPDELCMGNARDLQSIVLSSGEAFAGGNQCVRCYYGGYNRVLKSLLEDIEHEEFV